MWKSLKSMKPELYQYIPTTRLYIQAGVWISGFRKGSYGGSEHNLLRVTNLSDSVHVRTLVPGPWFLALLEHCEDQGLANNSNIKPQLRKYVILFFSFLFFLIV